MFAIDEYVSVSYPHTWHVPQVVTTKQELIVRAASTKGVRLVIRHQNKVGVLAGVLDSLREEDVNIEEMSNIIFSGNEAASASLLLDHSPSDKALLAIGSRAEIIQIDLS